MQTDESIDALARAVVAGADRAALPHDAALVLAVSGGADSMALLHGAARAVDSRLRRWSLTVAHLDHALRAQSGRDGAFVEAAAGSLGIPAVVERVEVARLAAERRRSVEEAGREARYALLHRAAGAGWIATAHTADDNAETILLNLVRGSGLAGVAGIPRRRERIVRPLLDDRRSQLRTWLELSGIEFLSDPTNADPQAATRNLLRLEVLPRLERVNARVVESLLRFAALAADDDALLDALAAAELERRRGADGSVDWHAPPPRALGRRVLRLVVGDPVPSAERIEALLDAAEGPRGNLAIELGGGRRAQVRARRIGLE